MYLRHFDNKIRSNIMVWSIIENEEQATAFNKMYNYFCDSFIKEARYESGNYLNEKLEEVNYIEHKLFIIFQRTEPILSSIEMVFEGVERLSYIPIPQHFIQYYEYAQIGIWNGKVYFNVWQDFNPAIPEHWNEPEQTMVLADKLKWRVADEYIGKERNY
jgi:hypothetical protein